MSKIKKYALVGNILQTIVFLFYLVALPMFLIDKKVHTFSDFRGGNLEEITNMIVMFILFIPLPFDLTKLIISWIGYSKLDKAEGKGWGVFFLVMGILTARGFFYFGGVYSSVLSIFPILAVILTLVSGVLYILIYTKGERVARN